ncbi:MAG TPA: hypothetical protein VL400_05605 [Polyangiaceae bacterium]|jgi:hypothetical protein|nr:hypothetical protein [Polyangiaceae bacterium]
MEAKKLHPFTLVALAAFAAGCHSKTADDVEPCVKTTAETVGQAAKTGGETAVAGLETAGTAVGGLFEGGTSEAKKKWDAGKQKTRETARGDAADTKAAGQQVDCK